MRKTPRRMLHPQPPACCRRWPRWRPRRSGLGGALLTLHTYIDVGLGAARAAVTEAEGVSCELAGFEACSTVDVQCRTCTGPDRAPSWAWLMLLTAG